MNKKYLALITAAAVFATASHLHAQSQPLAGAAKWADSAAREIDAATDAGDMARLKAAKLLLDRALIAFPNDPLLLHYKGYELHREASLMEGMGQRESLGSVLDEAQQNLEKSLALKPMPETQALLSSIMGRQIALQPYKAMILGPRSGSAMTEALALDAKNPRVWLLRGMGAIFTPEQYGGGLANAEAYLRTSAQLFENDHPLAPAPSWGRAEVYAWLGQIYQKQNKQPEAIAAYNKALQIDPDFHWVQYVLLPSAQKR
jgi:tetratricopeptide (TPR) repeat protein